jgi:hypothetical protein
VKNLEGHDDGVFAGALATRIPAVYHALTLGDLKPHNQVRFQIQTTAATTNTTMKGEKYSGDPDWFEEVRNGGLKSNLRIAASTMRQPNKSPRH